MLSNFILQIFSLEQDDKAVPTIESELPKDDVDKSTAPEGGSVDTFEENFKELQKWVDIKSSKFGTLYVIRERRSGRSGTALKVNRHYLSCYLSHYLVHKNIRDGKKNCWKIMVHK